jgi:peptidoglycan/xylan/chitin deacetylase (PgdA/CDA1 family)
MMRVPGGKIMRRAMRPLVRTLFPGAVVLGYHRVAEAQWDPLQLAVSPENFSAQLAELQSVRQVISLAELAARHRARERLDRYAVLTFDDGYVDFADTVAPIASQAQAPVTVFVASGYTGRDFWWDELAALLGPELRGEPALELSINGGETLRFAGLERLEARIETACDVGGRLVGRPKQEIDSVLDQLRAWAGGPAAPSGRPMTIDELAAVARVPGVEIGAHTVSHGCLDKLSPEAQREEIAASKSALGAACGVDVNVFSYPHGALSGKTPDIVASLGFSCACMSRDGVFGARDNPYLIPRLWVSDIDGTAFRSWLGNWVAEARSLAPAVPRGN